MLEDLNEFLPEAVGVYYSFIRFEDFAPERVVVVLISLDLCEDELTVFEEVERLLAHLLECLELIKVSVVVSVLPLSRRCLREFKLERIKD